jgi:hypothetical protein
MDHQIIKTEQKALDINLSDEIYGTFAEIGAGQEVARNFFQVGAAANTIAKTMSAYDKTFSDAIYGLESTGRYVCETRLYKMLDHEWTLIDQRLNEQKSIRKFFVFADTIAAINYSKTIKGNGWLGIRFQLAPDSEPNQLVLHARMHDTDNKLQQEAIGLLGVNMMYACFFYNNDLSKFVRSLHDALQGRISIDLIRLTGPDFSHVDNRLLSLYLVKYGLTEITMFDEHSQSVHASEFLYKKSLMVVRGHFRPPTLVTMDAIAGSFEQFKESEKIGDSQAEVITELTIDYLNAEKGQLDEKDFLDRSDLICALGHKTIISNCNNHQMLINYLSEYKIKHLGLVIGVNELLEIINEKYFQNQDGRLLVAFGELFTRNIRIYAYPALSENRKDMLTAANLPVPTGIKFLYRHLTDTRQIIDVENYNQDLLHIFPNDVLHQIRSGDNAWEKYLPAKLAEIIKVRGLLGYPKRSVYFEY